MLDESTNIESKIRYDNQISIATGKKRTTKEWKNRSLPWSKLVEKLSNTYRTNETVEEYKSMSKKEKSEIKDVGGFVGGTLKNGSRKAENVANRSLITLDLDYVTDQYIWEGIELVCDYSVLMYSTHSHTPENPRLRLVIPLSRPVLPDEYQAIARMIASDIGIDQFDDTTYQPHRLMFYPSTCKDGEFIFKLQDYKWLDPDSILERYTFGWEDVSYYPTSSRQDKIIQNDIKKQGDPLEKKGLIGAFCRTYSISEAIESFLDDIYLVGDGERYTYIEGSTSGGVVVYEDKFSYSHHATDPASMQLCNSFDLVRIHKFRELDLDSKIDTPINKLPSFKAMQEFAANDDKLKILLSKEKIQNASEEFEIVDPGDTDSENSDLWMTKLEYNTKGDLKNTTKNFMLIMENDINLKNKIGYDEFSNRLMIKDKLPWTTNSDFIDWSDRDDAGMRNYLETIYGLNSRNKCDDALTLVFLKNSYHPVKDYLNSLVWDGVKRIDNLFIDYLGAKDCDYSKAISRKILVAAVSRIFIPGIKFDNMVVLYGKQGFGKSTFINKLGREWYSDSLTTVTGKEAYEQLQGNWIIEMGELTATKKAEVEATKHFLSKQEDNYRPAYGRRTTKFKRQSVFFGTTNDDVFLKDSTGNRRYWIVDVGTTEPTKNIFKNLDSEIDQIWAEALELFKQGEKLYLSKAEELEAKEIQETHSEINEKIGIVEEFLEKKITKDWYTRDPFERRTFINSDDFINDSIDLIERTRVSTIEIWVELFGGDIKNFTRYNSIEINAILENIKGWAKSKTSQRFGKGYGTQRSYKRIVEVTNEVKNDKSILGDRKSGAGTRK